MNPAPPTPFQKWQLIALATFTLLLSGGMALWFLQPGAADKDASGKAAAANHGKARPASAPAPAAMPQTTPPAAPQAAAGADGQPRPTSPPPPRETPALNATTAVAQAPAQPPQTPAPAGEPAETPASLLAQPLDLADPAKREEVVRKLREMEDKRKEAAWELARQKGIAIRGKRPNGKEFELQYFENGEPVYHVTNNVNAAISTGAHQVRGTSPFNVTGAGVTTGIWDSGIPRLTHQEFGSRITVMDGHATVSEHANHVTGTIAAAGVEPSIKGMAPEVLVNSYYFGNDVSEMTNAGAALPGQAGKLYLSNHSYGDFLGWDYQGGSLPDDWYGTFSNNSNPADDLEDDFGRYASTSVAYDGLCSNLPYYLPFFAAGNERTDTPPPAGFPWYHISTGNTYSYNASQHPAGDDSYKGGYDNIGGDAVSKNVMTVGAVNDAVVSSSRNLPAATITTFSSYGPADDGRIKPDIVANGQSLTSTGISSNSATSTKSGTSMATPNATGSAALLVNYYGTRFPGQAMRAATLKGLIIHTADDLGNPGPDYRFGWGLMNTKAAADLLKNHADKAGNGRLVESSLSTTVTSRTHSFVWNGTTPLRVTLCWTDPAGTSKAGHDNRTKALVNDLNLSIAPPPGGGSTLRPYVMPHVGDWTNATLNSNAVTGVNTVDNVEQIYLPAPLTGGVYTVTVNHTGTLANGEQPYSLIVSGELSEPLTVTPDTPFVTSGPQGGPFTPGSGTYTLTNTGGSSLNWNATAATFLNLSPQNGTLAAGASTTVTVAPSALANTLGGGIYSTPVLFTNSGTTVSQSVSATLTVVPAATLPFTENFESPTLAGFWSVSGTGPFRTALSTANSPHGGTRHVVMDSSSSSSYARNELTLAANLAGRGSVMLSFWAREFGDEVNTPPAGSFANGANFDGVAISADGITWHPVLAMPAVFESHTQFSVNLDEAVSAAGLTYGQLFRIRFNQYDDNAVPTDGIAWDDISLTSGAVSAGTLGFSAATYSINEDQGTATITVTRASGSQGAASVGYATSNGSATAGSDYTTTSGTLSWTANQPGPKSFTIPIINDTTAEPAETINLTLSSAVGAVLGAQTTATLSIANDDSTPEIVVEQPAGLGLADGSGGISFGARAMGVSTAAKTVVVRNTGSADLTGLSVTKDGGEAGDFLVGTLGSTTLAPGASTTFTVQFTPSALGARNAAIHIASSDLDENPFDITLSGTGASQADSLIFEIASLDSTGSAVTDHSSLTGDDRGGIAVSSSRVFVAGDSNTSSHALGNLSGGVSLGAVRDGLCSDLQTGTVYNLAHNGAGFVTGGSTVSQLIEMDPVSGALTANVITLSAPVPVASNSGVFSGSGRVVIHNGTHVYDIRLPSGTVTNLGEMARPAWQGAENWAMWGVAEFFTGKLFLTYRATGTHTIVRTRVPDGQTQTIATFTSLGEMANWTASPANNRWYFHVEGSSQFGGSGEMLGYANATYNQGPPTAPPVITSPLTAGGLAGQAFSYQITASGSATNFGASGLPPGLSVNVETGLISGSAAAGIYPVTISASNAVETSTASMTLTLQTPAPEIAIADGATQLTDNVSNLTFTNVNLGSSSTARTITISNPGTGPLTGFPITVSGANPGDFVVSTPGSSSLAPAGTTTFTITFTPTQAGARAATIQVASNDADENPFDFTVQGTAVPQPPSITSTTASKVELDTATLNCLVNPRGGTTSVTFDWGLTTSYGTTTTAQNVGNGVTPVNASVRLAGLLPNTTYNFRATATSSDGSATSSNVSFTTGIAYYVNDGSTTNDAWCTAVGNDSNNGLTPATPKATVQAIISTYVLEPADVVRIDTGSYSLATDIVVSSTDAGSTSAPVVFEASPYGVDMTRQVPSFNTYMAWSITGSNITLRTAASQALPAVAKRFMRLGWSGAGSGTVYGVSSSSSAANTVLSRIETLARSYGIYSSSSGCVIENCLLRGGSFGIYKDSSTSSAMLVRNCTITGFSAYGIYSYYAAALNLRNTIVVADGSNRTAVYIAFSGTGMISDHNLLQARNGALLGNYGSGLALLTDWQTATGKDMRSLSIDPLFVDADGADNIANNTDDDLHLQSTAGSYKAGVFTADAGDSPVLDAGDPAVAVGDEPAPHGGRVNLGADGGTEFASKTPAGRRLLLVSPNGGESLSSTRTVYWNSFGQAWQAGDTVALEYSNNGGSTWQAISGAGALVHSTGQHAWDVSALPSGGYRVRVNYGGGSVMDGSDATFVIRRPTMIYYVNDSATTNDAWCTAVGNDANEGLTPAAPKATVQAVLSSYDLEPGDVVRIDTGSYSLGTDITVSAADGGGGTSSEPVVFEASPYGVDMTRQVTSSANTYAWAIDGVNVTLRTAESTALPGVPQRFLRLGWSGSSSGFMFGVLVNSAATNCLVSHVDMLPRTIGVWSYAAGTVVENCVVRGGTTAINFESSGTTAAKTVRQCTLVGFSSRGIYAYEGGGLRLSGNIVVADGSGDHALYLSTAATSIVSDHNCLVARNGAFIGNNGTNGVPNLAEWQAAMPGKDTHSISIDPLFVDADGADNVPNNTDDDLHLQSTAGSFKAGAFTADAGDSPALDAGDPTVAVGDEPAPNGGRVNLGAYGGTRFASKTPTGRRLLLVSPNGGESISGGTRTIYWNAQGQGWLAGDTVALEYSTDGGATWQVIAGAGALNHAAGQYVWDSSGLASGGYRVRVNYGGGSVVDGSDTTFVMRSPVMTYYVNDGALTNDAWCTAAGSDASDGLTPATPKATVQSILATYDVEPGDVVRIDTGSYSLTTDIAIPPADGGSSLAAVVFEASPYGVDMIRQAGSSATYVWSVGAPHVTLRTAQGLPPADARQRLLRLGWAGAGIGTVSAVYVGATNCTLSRVETLARTYGVHLLSSACVIDTCLLRGGTHGIYHDAYTSGPGLGVRNCTITGFATTGIYSYYASTLGVRNSIVVADGAGRTCIAISSTSSGMVSDHNCLVVRNGASTGTYSTTRATLVDWRTATGKDAASISTEPLFTDADGLDNTANNADDDFHIPLASPCRDAGDSTAATAGMLDLDGQDRIFGAAVDMGADEYHNAPEIEVELAGTPLTDGISTVSFGGAAIGLPAPAPLVFTIRNVGAAPLTGLTFGKAGADHAHFTVDLAATTATVAAGASTTFTIGFLPNGASSLRTATLSITSNDIDENPFDLALTAAALSTTADADSDGMKDWGEHQLAALGFDWQVANPDLVTAYYAAANSNGLYTPSQVQALHVGTPLIQRNPATGAFTLTIGVQKSTNLTTFTPLPMTAPQTVINGAGKLEFQFTTPGNAAFFRLQSQ